MRKKNKELIVPGPGQYEVRGKIGTKKGFSFTGKKNDKIISNASDFVKLSSDFDIINDHPT